MDFVQSVLLVLCFSVMSMVFNASAVVSYDAAGNLVQSGDGLCIQRQQSYDALNRLVQTIDNCNGAN